MTTIAEVVSLLDKLNNNIAETLSDQTIDDAVKICLDWFDSTPSTATLAHDWENHPYSTQDKSSLARFMSINLHSLAGTILDRLLLRLAIERAEDEAIGNSYPFDQSRFYQKVLLNPHLLNPQVKRPNSHGASQEFLFYELIACNYMEGGIKNDEELFGLISCLSKNDVIAMLHCITEDRYSCFFDWHHNYNAAEDFVNKIIQIDPTLSKARVIDAMAKQPPECYGIHRARCRFLLDDIIDDALKNHLDNLISVLDQACNEDNKNTMLTTLTMTFELLTCDDLERGQLLEDYQAYALTLKGSPSSTGKAIGVAMFAFGVCVIALGATAIISGGIIPIACGASALVIGLGIFAFNGQKGQSKHLQNIHDSALGLITEENWLRPL